MFRNNEFMKDLLAAEIARKEQRLVLGGLRAILQDDSQYYIHNVQPPFDWKQDDMELSQGNVAPQEVPELPLEPTSSSTTLPPNGPNHSSDSKGSTHIVNYLIERPDSRASETHKPF
jgi:hypothetical protein